MVTTCASVQRHVKEVAQRVITDIEIGLWIADEISNV